MMLICSFSFTALALAFSAAESSAQTAPTVTVANGTYQGFYQSFYDQDIFLGIPYAQPPVGPLRLAPPQSLNESFTSIKRVTEYSLICPGNNITVGVRDLCDLKYPYTDGPRRQMTGTTQLEKIV